MVVAVAAVVVVVVVVVVAIVVVVGNQSVAAVQCRLLVASWGTFAALPALTLTITAATTAVYSSNSNGDT